MITNNNNVDTKPKKNIEVKIKKIKTPRSTIFLRHSGYNRIYKTSIMMWKERPLTGFGLKSFRFKCWDMLDKDNRTVDAISIIEKKINRRRKINI